MPNTGLTAGQVVPGVYGYVDFNAAASGVAPNLRCLLFGYMGASGTATPNLPFKPASQTDVEGKCVAGTDASRIFAAALAQPDAQGAEVWVLPVTAPSGTASIYTAKVFIPGGANPSKPGAIQLWVCSQQLPSIGFTTSDTATTIGAAIAAAINAIATIPITAAAAAGVVTITYRHTGLTGEDLPIRCTIGPFGTGVNFSPAQLLFATNATGAGSVLVQLGAVTITTALIGGETPAQVATKVAAAVNASTYPVTAVVDGTTPQQVDLYFNNGWDVRRIAASIVTTTGLTVNAGSGATSGTGSPSSLSYNGTLGVGLPSLTQAITNLTSLAQWWRSWASPWIDATSLGTLATYIEAAENGSLTGQKLQVLTVCDFNALTVAGAVPPSVSPNLTTTPPHYAYGWSPDVPVQAFEIAARVAAARAALWISTPQKNWNGYRLLGNAEAPLLAPPTTVDKNTLNSALRTYAVAPFVLGGSGNIEIVKGRTTSLAGNIVLWSWSAEAQAAFHWFDLTNYFTALFQGGNLIRYSDPKAPGIFDTNSFVDATKKRMRYWERLGNYDGADALASGVNASINVNNINRVDVNYPESPVLDLDQVAFSGYYMQPSA